MTDEPSVLAWLCVMAPRPREYTPRPHWWRRYVTDAWRAAFDAWLVERERATMLYPTEVAEWVAAHPSPRLGDFMRHLSHGTLAPESVLHG